MNDTDDSTAAAPRPHRQSDDTDQQSGSTSRPGAWARIRAMLNLKSPSLRDDLREALVDTATDDTAFSPSERAILQNVLKLGDMRVEHVMVPRADIDAVEAGETMAMLLGCFREAAHSRLPIYEDNLDNIVGFIHIKDAMQRVTAVAEDGASGEDGSGEGARNGNGQATPVKFQSSVLRQKISRLKLMRKVLFVPPSMPVGDLLQSMQATRVHMAVVIDEYGGTDGLLTIEDLLEAVVGEIEDEHDDAETALVTRVDDNTFVADARAELAELREVIGSDFDPGTIVDEVDTLGGLIFDLTDRVPVRGEVITRLKGFEFEILAADPRRIRKVRILRRKRGVRSRKAPGGAGTAQAAE